MMKFPTIPMCEQVPCTNNMKGLKAFLYCRVAYNDGFSLELQANELRHFAEQAGFTIAGEAAEYGSSLTLNRAALKEITQSVQNGKVDVVLVKSVSRIARNLLQLQEYIDFLTAHNVSLYCVKEQLLFRGEAQT